MNMTPAELIIEDESDIEILQEYTGRGEDIKILYHYTNLEGLIGIINSNKLRLTNSYFLNDSTEYEHGLVILRIVLRRLERDKTLSLKFNYIQGLKTKGFWKNSLRDGVFTASFCIKKDLLSQWRAYSGGIGVNIGFLSEPMLDYVDAMHGKAIYSVKNQAEILEKIIRACLEIIPLDYDYVSAGHKDPVVAILAKIFLILPFFKNRHFEEETEYRIVYRMKLSDEKHLVKHVSLSQGIKSYIELPFESKEWNSSTTNEIGQVTVGPAEHQSRVANEIKEFIKMKGITGIKVRRSKIPLSR